MPRAERWEGRGRYVSEAWREIEPLAPVSFTPELVMVKRLELAQELVELVLHDGADLAETQRRTLGRVREALAALRRQASG